MAYGDNGSQLESQKLGEWPKPGQISEDAVAISGYENFFFLYKGSNHYYGAYSPSTDDVSLASQWAEAFARWREKCSELGAKFCVAIVPNKATVLPDLYPLDLANKCTCRMEKLIEMTQRDDLNVFNSFLDRPDPKSLFRRNDSHLTDWGNRLLCDFIKSDLGMSVAEWEFDAAALGATENKGDLGGRFQPEAREKLVRFLHDWDQFEILDQAEATKKGGFVGIGYHAKNKSKNDGSRMVAFGNSFIERIPSWGVAPWLASTVSDFHFSWGTGVNFDEVEKLSPDYVVFQTCERFLCRPPSE